MAAALAMGVLVGQVVLVAGLTAAARRYAVHRSLLDQPGERRSHHVATPRGGGIAIVLAMLLAGIVAATVFPAARTSVALACVGLLLVAGIGWWDDHRPLPAIHRLLVHLMASGLLALAVWLASGDVLLAGLVFLLSASLINLWNFMDGINGIAASHAVAAGLGLAWVLPPPYAMAPLLLAAAALGFLPFNFPRARIFMGDVGSGALGYMVAALVGLGATHGTAAWPALLLPFSPFLVDAGFTLLSRMLGGQRWMEPHAQHVYQRAVRAGASHAQVTAAYFLLGMIGSTVLAVSGPLSPVQQTGAAVAWWLVLTGLWAFLRFRLRDI